MECVLEGIPFTRNWFSFAKLAPGRRFSSCNGLRTFPIVDPTAPDSVRTGRLSAWSEVMLWLTSPLSVFSNGLAASTVTESPAPPTSSAMSMRNTVATETITPARTNRLNPGKVAEIS